MHSAMLLVINDSLAQTNNLALIDDNVGERLSLYCVENDDDNGHSFVGGCRRAGRCPVWPFVGPLLASPLCVFDCLSTNLPATGRVTLVAMVPCQQVTTR